MLVLDDAGIGLVMRCIVDHGIALIVWSVFDSGLETDGAPVKFTQLVVKILIYFTTINQGLIIDRWELSVEWSYCCATILFFLLTLSEE